MLDTKKTVIRSNDGELEMKKTWDENTLVKMMVISPSIETIEVECFSDLSYCIIEASESFWKNYIIKKIWVRGNIKGTQIFKVVPKNGKYYYSYCYNSEERMGDRGYYTIDYYQTIGRLCILLAQRSARWNYR